MKSFLVNRLHKLLLLMLLIQYGQQAQVSAQENEKEFHAFIPNPQTPPRLVNDFADLLSEEQEFSLESKLLKFNNETSNELTLITVSTLHDMEVGEFTQETARKWKIGKAGRNNGVLMLMSSGDRKIFIAPASGLQGVLPDVVCGRIIRNDILPRFREGNYYGGFDAGIESIMAASRGEFINDLPVASKGLPVWMGVFLIFAFALLFFVIAFLFSRRKDIYVSRRGYKYDQGGWGGGWFGGGSGWSDSGWNSGSSGSSSSGGGGFGGFGGGGGFDGGGAGGSW